MTESITATPPTNAFEAIQQQFHRYLTGNYTRFPFALVRGRGCEVWDSEGRRYLDMGAGIAVNCLGHAHPELTAALTEQANKIWHPSNLYYNELQGELGQSLASRVGAGKVFFCNSGAEANEGLYKLARRYGHEDGRFEILTATSSFHGRTLAGIAATAQAKVKQGFGPQVPGFRHVPFNDLQAIRQAISPATVAVLIEGIQGEGGIHPAQPDYLLGLKALCEEQGLLFLFDGVQCGHYRTGRFQSFQRLLAGTDGAETFLPDGLAMAKGLGGGFPLGAIWIKEAIADRFSPGSHGTTFGGNPLACSVALKILEIIDRDQIPQQVESNGAVLRQRLQDLAHEHSGVIREIRGLGLMLGIELNPDSLAFRQSTRPPCLQVIDRLHEKGLLTIPAGTAVVRLLPSLNLKPAEMAEAIEILSSTFNQLAS